MEFTLNQFVKSIAGQEENRGRKKHGSYKLDFDLSPELTRLYEIPMDFATNENGSVYHGIQELISETVEHRGDGMKIITRIAGEQRAQVVEILSKGEPLSAELLEMLNRAYILGRDSTYCPPRNGTQRAGFFLKPANGVITIENCDEGPYTVRNKVVIP